MIAPLLHRWAVRNAAVAAAAMLVFVCSWAHGQTGPDFRNAITPILSHRCVSCHNGSDPKGGLSLQTRTAMLQGGDSGSAVVPGSASDSLLYARVASGEMPPDGKDKVTAEELHALEQWINSGAPGTDEIIPLPTDSPFEITAEDRAHWAFQPLRPTPVPTVAGAADEPANTPVDSFIRFRLREHGLDLSPEADRRTLIRRVYLDLIGLPPTPAEITAFESDRAEDAYERLLDRLLASPHFGERWGRHWLDGAGYADVIGMDNDAGIISTGENKWLYRDYVVRALNADKPFSRFLVEQIAGDELADWRSADTFTPEMRDRLIATGFLRNSADDTSANELNTPLIQHGVLQRTGEVLVSNLLGLTLNCAKCHDHKYEPIAQRDYYQVMALLQPAFNPTAWLQPAQRQLPDIAPAEKQAAEQHNAQIEQHVAQLQAELSKLNSSYEQGLLATKLQSIPEPIRQDTQTALATPADQRNAIQAYLSAKFENQLKVTAEEVSAALTSADREISDQLQQRIAQLNAQRRSWGHLQAVYDVAPPTPTYLLVRGDPLNLGAEVPPGFLQVLHFEGLAQLAPTAEQGSPTGSSGRRLALAHWLTDASTPAGALVLRVRVNRVWQQLFGRGLVETADNFGVTGAQPTHPELLEWLANEFAAGGQQHKAFLKLLMRSRVYRQVSQRSESPSGVQAPEIDPENRLLWRMPLRRMESEAIRDAVLVASDQLNRTFGGAPIPVEQQPDGSFAIKVEALPQPDAALRRSLYLLARRNYHPTLLGVFDQPNMATNCARRSDSAVVLQALTLLNDRFVLEQSQQCAKRIVIATGSRETLVCIDAAFEQVLGRPPRSSEQAACAEIMQRHIAHYSMQGLSSAEAQQNALAHLCQVLFNTSEFLYIP